MKRFFLLLATISILFGTGSSVWAVSEINLYFPPKWKDQPEVAYKITAELSREVGINIIPQIADCYPEILTALTQKKPVLSYVGSMVQTIVWTRKLGTPLLQALDLKEYYGGVLIYPKSISPSAILKDYPAEIAYTVGATSGEICAKVATSGKASIAVTDQRTAVDTIKSGKAKAAFVKNTWWAENSNNYPEFTSYIVPGVSDFDNADNVLLVSNFVAPEIKTLILDATTKVPQIFNANLVIPFDSYSLIFTQKLMGKAGMDPLTYTWPQVGSGQCTDKSTISPLMPTDSASQNIQASLDGEMLLEKKCGYCHLFEKVKKYNRKTREQWGKTLTRKFDMGVELTAAERAALIDFLLSLKR